MTSFQKATVAILGLLAACIMLSLTVSVGWLIFLSPLSHQARVAGVSPSTQTGTSEIVPTATQIPGGRSPLVTGPGRGKETTPTSISALTATQTPTSVADSTAPPSSPVISFDFQVLDAEYSSTLERIIMVSEDPNKLHIYDPATQTDVTVDVSYQPTSVSVGPDGKFAAVGHDAKISYVDLDKAEVVKTLDVTADVFDVVLAGNGWVYVSPRQDQWETLRAIEIATNREIQGEGLIHAGSVYKLHPDGQSLYGADHGISPSDIEKVDISQGTPVYAYDSPYHGDYEMCGNLWMAEDGKRIFTACGNVFRAMSNRDHDMTYNGSLDGVRSIHSVAHAATANSILVLDGPGPRARFDDAPTDDRLMLFDYETLQKVTTIPLPTFGSNGTAATAHGRFVFSNPASAEYYVIVQADEDSGLLNDFGLVINEFPASIQPGETQTDQAEITPEVSFSGPIIPLNALIIDAEYSLTLDRLIMVSDDPARLHIYDASNQQDVQVDLSYAPTSVSVGPDGKFAAVGHDAKISYVDLDKAEVVKTLDVTADVLDIVLAGNGWIYVSPRQDQSSPARLHAVEIATNNETQSQRPITAGTVYKLHPDGQSLYGADHGISPSDIEKVDISQGTPVYAYDSPYHGDYEMCGNLWMAEDGQRIFTACGNVFQASSNRDEDMTYSGSLSRLPFIRHVIHSAAANRVLALPYEREYGIEEGLPESQFVIFGYETFNTEEIVTLPDFIVNGGSFAAYGRFVFVNSAGSHYYIVVQADGTSGLLNGFGIVIGEF
jgi:exosome complex RNA-binding protein Rrp4